MADWLKVFRMGERQTVLAINEQPAGGSVPAIRLEARLMGRRLEQTYTFASQAEADSEFALMGSRAARKWVQEASRKCCEVAHA